MQRFVSSRCFAAVGRRAFSAGVTMNLTEDQNSFVDLARNFARDVFEPKAAQWDRDHHFPEAELREAAKLGFGAMYTNPEHGGTGLTRLDASLIFEQLSMADPSTTAYISIHNMCAWMIDEFGSTELKKELIPDLANMEKFASYCLTEPSSGSDAASLKTVAKDCGDHYEVSGSKAFISGAGSANLYLVMVRTGTDGPKGITCLAIDTSMKGVSFGKNELKMGWRSQPTRVLSLDQVKVPKSRVVGKVGEGFKIAMKGLDGGRVNIASCSLGSAQRCLEYATSYTKERKQFGGPLTQFQNTQFKLAEMAANVHTSRLIIREAARSLDDQHPERTTLCAMAKMTATERCYQVVDEALQLHGGYGYLNDFPIERHLRDLRVHRILEGTNEVMRLIVSRAVLKD
jgi:alkylation response protein AidB-like acyl-CoA dehydrogenase